MYPVYYTKKGGAHWSEIDFNHISRRFKLKIYMYTSMIFYNVNAICFNILGILRRSVPENSS